MGDFVVVPMTCLLEKVSGFVYKELIKMRAGSTIGIMVRG